MTGKLTDTDKGALEMWIGSGPKKFTLLYSITKDGCVGTTFHQKCNQQGPTVVVLYNQQGSVFGGYTSQNWTSHHSGSYDTDTNAFMYQLHFAGQKEQRRFGIKNFGNAIHNNGAYGPIFGAGFDLCTFNGNITPSGGVYALNGGKMNLNHTYDTQGLTAGKINNGSMEVTELEVYKVTVGQKSPAKPWRDIPAFDEKFLGRLKEDLYAMKPARSSGLSQYRILMLGPVGSGKSSFYNTINSVFRGRISQPAVCGKSEHGITQLYKSYDISADGDSALGFRLCDTCGLGEHYIDALTSNLLLGGHIPESYRFTSHVLPERPDVSFVAKPAASDKIHCVVFVVDASSDLPEAIVSKMKHIQQQINEREIPQMTVLTHVDKLDVDLHENLANTFKNMLIQDKVQEISTLLGQGHRNIWPVKNYDREFELNASVSVLALLAVRHMLNLASDFVDRNVAELSEGACGGLAVPEVQESDTVDDDEMLE